jgi:hypothetical protein
MKEGKVAYPVLSYFRKENDVFRRFPGFCPFVLQISATCR